MVDVDHFKKFNDTFGHDTGDQVLRMVAARLAQATGGGKAFRCGGEEFAVLFAGKSAKEAYAHAEGLRQSIEEATFVVRSPARVRRSEADRGRATGDERGTAEDRRKVSDRRKTDRSLQGNQVKIEERRSNNGRRSQNEDRRSKMEDRRSKSGRRSRSRGADGPQKTVEVFVTVSIGLAEASTRLVTPDMVLQAADKALYRAKDAGRNRVEIYRPMSRGTRIREAASAQQEREGKLAPTEVR
jgi:GGDEF domain-containing protein